MVNYGIAYGSRLWARQRLGIPARSAAIWMVIHQFPGIREFMSDSIASQTPWIRANRSRRRRS